jgi:hypothetical protein
MKTTIAVLLFAPFWATAQTNKVIVFPVLQSTNGTGLMTNAEFRILSGRRLTFRDANGKLKAFDVREINTNDLARLQINPDVVERDLEFRRAIKEKTELEARAAEIERIKKRDFREINGVLHNINELDFLDGKVISVLPEGLLINLEKRDSVVYVKCSSTGWVDGEEFVSYAKPNGTFKYSSAAGAAKTVASYIRAKKLD